MFLGYTLIEKSTSISSGNSYILINLSKFGFTCFRKSGFLNTFTTSPKTPFTKNFICIIVFIVLVAIVFGAYIIINKKNQSQPNTGTEEGIAPEIILNLSSEKKDLESVDIEISTHTADEEGVASIILPDGESVFVSDYWIR